METIIALNMAEENKGGKMLKKACFMLFALLFIAAAAWADHGCFAVTAYNDFGESEYSNVVCTSDAEVNVDVLPGGTVVLGWNVSAGASGYKVYYRRAEAENWALPVDVGNVLTYPVPAAAIFCPADTAITGAVVNNP